MTQPATAIAIPSPLAPPLAGARQLVERYLSRRVRDEGLREEIAQETMIRAFRFLPALCQPEAIGGWLRSIARNQAATTLRREGRRREVPFSALMEARLDRPAPASIEEALGGAGAGRPVCAAEAPECPRRFAERRELMAHVAEAMGSLPERQRLAFELFALESKSVAEVAQAMECSEGAVKFHIHAARKKLKARLAAHLGR